MNGKDDMDGKPDESEEQQSRKYELRPQRSQRESVLKLDWRMPIFLSAAFLLFAVFIGITFLEFNDNGMNRDLFMWINVMHSSQLMDALMPIVTLVCDIPFWTALIICIWFFDKRMLANSSKRKATVLLAFTLCISTLLALVLQLAFAVPRPDGIVGMRLLVWKEATYSYPSGHAMRGFAAASVSLLVLKKRFSLPAVLVAAIVAYSRVYVGVHYPYDVIAGACLGVCCAVLMYVLMEKQQIFNRAKRFHCEAG